MMRSPHVCAVRGQSVGGWFVGVFETTTSVHNGIAARKGSVEHIDKYAHVDVVVAAATAAADDGGPPVYACCRERDGVPVDVVCIMS